MAYTSMEPSDNELLFEDDIIALTEQLGAAKQRELELLAVIETQRKALQLIATPSTPFRYWKIARDALVIEPSKALREMKADVLEDAAGG